MPENVGGLLHTYHSPADPWGGRHTRDKKTIPILYA